MVWTKIKWMGMAQAVVVSGLGFICIHLIEFRDMPRVSVVIFCILCGLRIYSCDICLLFYAVLFLVCSQNTEMWRDFNKVNDVVQAAMVWLLTLEKQGCSTMLQAGIVSHLFYLPTAGSIYWCLHFTYHCMLASKSIFCAAMLFLPCIFVMLLLRHKFAGGRH